MRKIGTILSPECKTYSKDIENITTVPEYINLQYLRLIENLVCQRICEQVLENKKECITDNPVTVEIPLIGNLTITPVNWHKSHLGTGKSSLHFDFDFEPLPTFKKHIQSIYTTDNCELISLLSEQYSKILVNNYSKFMEEL